jgi:hypothetical protein
MIRLLTDKIFLLTLCVIGGIIYYHADLLLWAVLANWVIYNCVSLIVHYDWSHKYLIPKNTFFKFILDVFGYLTALPGVSPRLFWKHVHQIHHRNWKDPEADYLQWELNHNHWVRYLFTVNARNTQHSSNWSKDLPQENTFFEKYFNLIIVSIHLCLFLILGFKYYFYFVLLQVWAFDRQMALVGEILPHINKITKEDERDFPWLFLYYGESAYHVSHHRYPLEFNLGKGWIKYLNIQYYFIKLFYNINPKVNIL